MPALTADNFANYLTSAVANSGGLAAGATSLTLPAGDGARLPATLPATLTLGTTTSGPAPEIVRVTARSGDTLTIVRAQEGTAQPAGGWPQNTQVQQTLTAGAMANLWAAVQQVNAALSAPNIAAGSFPSGAFTFPTKLVLPAGLTDAGGGNGLLLHDNTTNIELKPDTAGYGLQLDYRTAAGPQRALSISGSDGSVNLGAASGAFLVDQLGTVSGTGIANAAAPTVAPATGTTLGIGNYKYGVTFYSTLGETKVASQTTVTTTSGNQAVTLSAIPTGPTGTVGRKIYRSLVGGTQLFLLATLADNTTTGYSDTATDASISSNAAAPVHPSIGGDIWKNSSGTVVAQIYGDGAIKFDGGAVTSDGAGNWTSVGNETATGLTTLNGPGSVPPGTSSALSGTYAGGFTLNVAGPLSGDNGTSFNGSTGYVALPTTNLPAGASAITLEGWVKATAIPGSGEICAFDVGLWGTNLANLNVVLNSSSKFQVDNFGNGGPATIGTVSAGTWYHIAISYDGTTQRLYLNGALQNSQGITLALGAGGGAFIGGANATTNLWNGAIYGVAIYNYAVSGTRISAHAGATSSGNYQSLVMADTPLRFYLLDETSGTVAANQTASLALQVNGSAAVTGTLTLYSPPVLKAGNQETGMCGWEDGPITSGDFAGAAINFKTILTNAPTSLTLSALTAQSFGTPGITNLNVYGCSISAAATASGAQGWWFGRYTTVGNCLRAVDTTARTFDEHCDICGTLHTAVPLAQMAVDTTHGTVPGRYAMHYVCPTCGASEHYNTGLTSHDELNATPSPDGSTTEGQQAHFIRQLQNLLGLPKLA